MNIVHKYDDIDLNSKMDQFGNRLLFQKIILISFWIHTIINPYINIWTFERSCCSTFFSTVHGTKKMFSDRFDFSLSFCCINKCQFKVDVVSSIDCKNNIHAYSLWHRIGRMETNKIKVAKQLKSVIIIEIYSWKCFVLILLHFMGNWFCLKFNALQILTLIMISYCNKITKSYVFR